MNESCKDYIDRVRAMKPVVHCITNNISIWDCANALHAVGAAPTMAHHVAEVTEVTAACNALVCNLGATESYDAMLEAAKTASKLGHPIVVDPVGCGSSSFRREFFKKLAAKAQISCIRGNKAEIAALLYDKTTTIGVDARNVDTSVSESRYEHTAISLIHESAIADARTLARRYNCVVVASGAIDIITDGTRVEQLDCGTPMLTRITGTGCMSSAIIGAFLAAENSLEGIVAACLFVGKCGERAEAITNEQNGGTMTFHTALIDELSK